MWFYIRIGSISSIPESFVDCRDSLETERSLNLIFVTCFFISREYVLCIHILPFDIVHVIDVGWIYHSICTRDNQQTWTFLNLSFKAHPQNRKLLLPNFKFTQLWQNNGITPQWSELNLIQILHHIFTQRLLKCILDVSRFKSIEFFGWNNRSSNH